MGSSSSSRSVRVNTDLIGLSFFGFFCLGSLVPFIGHIFLPIFVVSHFFHTFLNDSKCLSDFIIFHVFFIIKIKCKLNKIIDFSLCLLVLLFFGGGPGWLCCTFLSSLCGSGGRFFLGWLFAQLTKSVGSEFIGFFSYWLNWLWIGITKTDGISLFLCLFFKFFYFNITIVSLFLLNLASLIFSCL